MTKRTWLVSLFLIVGLTSCDPDKMTTASPPSNVGNLTKKSVMPYVNDLAAIMAELAKDRSWLTEDIIKKANKRAVRLDELNKKLPRTNLVLKENHEDVNYSLVLDLYVPDHLEKQGGLSKEDFQKIRIALDPDQFYLPSNHREATSGIPSITALSYASPRAGEAVEEAFRFHKNRDGDYDEPIFFLDLRDPGAYTNLAPCEDCNPGGGGSGPSGTFICLAAYTLKFSQESGDEEIEIFESDGPDAYSHPFNYTTPWIMDGATRLDALQRARQFWDVNKVSHGRYGDPNNVNGWIAMKNLNTEIDFRLATVENDKQTGALRLEYGLSSGGTQLYSTTMDYYNIDANNVTTNVLSQFQYVYTDEHPDDIHWSSGVRKINFNALTSRIVNGSYFNTDSSPGTDLQHCDYYFGRLDVNN